MNFQRDETSGKPTRGVAGLPRARTRDATCADVVDAMDARERVPEGTRTPEVAARWPAPFGEEV